MTDFVLDSSVTFAWFFEDEQSDATDRILDRLEIGEAAVPALWHFDVANVLALGERRRRTTASRVTEFIARLGGLRILVDDDNPAQVFPRLVDLARDQRLTGYDAAYLELAMRLHVPLATKDVELAKAAARAGVEVLGID